MRNATTVNALSQKKVENIVYFMGISMHPWVLFRELMSILKMKVEMGLSTHNGLTFTIALSCAFNHSRAIKTKTIVS